MIKLGEAKLLIGLPTIFYGENLPYQKIRDLDLNYSLETNCVGTEDFTNIFDNEIGLIYFDYAHMGDAGNRIVAEKMFKISSSFVTDIQE